MPDVFHTHKCPDGTVFEFVWDGDKDEINQEKHEWTFNEAAEAFCDPRQVRIYDRAHSSRAEKRFVLLGKVKTGEVLTVRYTRRDKYIRIIGAGFWRDGLTRYNNSKRR